MDLLDLKQKAAALAEARSTSQQGRVIMLFTIVTIIFVSPELVSFILILGANCTSPCSYPYPFSPHTLVKMSRKYPATIRTQRVKTCGSMEVRLPLLHLKPTHPVMGAMALILEFYTILSSTDKRRSHSLGPASCILHHQTGEALVLGQTPCRRKEYRCLSILVPMNPGVV